MYICICKAITDKQIYQVINEGAHSRRQVYKCTGAGSVCGKCCHYIKQILDESLQNQPIMQAA